MREAGSVISIVGAILSSFISTLDVFSIGSGTASFTDKLIVCLSLRVVPTGISPEVHICSSASLCDCGHANV